MKRKEQSPKKNTSVHVLDRRGKPVMPTTPKRARQLLDRRRARVHKLKPFTIRIVDIFAENFMIDPDKLRLALSGQSSSPASARSEPPEAPTQAAARPEPAKAPW
jgi:hypothetical protein